MERPLNVDDVSLRRYTSTSEPDAEWAAGFFAAGGDGAEDSLITVFALEPGKRLGRHANSAEETHIYLDGAGTLDLDGREVAVRAGDVIVVARGQMHDLTNTGDRPLRAIGVFAAPRVEHRWTDVLWSGGASVTTSPD